MRAELDTTGRRIAKVAGRQHGIVTRRQLYAAGVSPSGVGRRVESGYLHRVHRGVYGVGHTAFSKEARWIAADGYRYHRGPTAFEDDHARDLDFRTQGHDVLHLTYRQVTTDPSQVADVLRRELEAPAPDPRRASQQPDTR